MADRPPETPRFRHRDLPVLWEWPFLLGGGVLLVAVPVVFVVSVEELGPGLLALLVAALMLAALLLALPCWLRYNLALYHTRPLPDRTVEAFEAVDGQIAALREVIQSDRRVVDEIHDRLRVIEESRGGDPLYDSGALAEIEMAVVELKLDMEGLDARLGQWGLQPEEGAGKPLPANLLEKAMSTPRQGGHRLIRQHPGATED